jgi:hypothetical protein
MADPATRAGGRRARPCDGPCGGRALAPGPERAGRDAAGVRRDARPPGARVACAARGSDPGGHPCRGGGHRAVRPGTRHASDHLSGARRGAGDAPAWPADAANRRHWEPRLSESRAGRALGTAPRRGRVPGERTGAKTARAERGHAGWTRGRRSGTARRAARRPRRDARRAGRPGDRCGQGPGASRAPRAARAGGPATPVRPRRDRGP